MSVKLTIEFIQTGGSQCKTSIHICGSNTPTAEEMARATGTAGSLIEVLREHHGNEIIDLQVSDNSIRRLITGFLSRSEENKVH